MCACSSHHRIFVQRPWPSDQLAVVSVLDAHDQPTHDPYIFPPRAPIDLELTASGMLHLDIHTFTASLTAPNGIAPSACGIVNMGEGTPLPAAATAWSSSPFDQDSSSIELHAEPTDCGPPLLWNNCTGNAVACGEYRATRIDAPAGWATNRVAAVADDLAFFSFTTAETTTHTSLLGRIDGLHASMLPRDPRMRGVLDSITYDGMVVWGTQHSSVSQDIIQLGSDGRFLSARASSIDAIATGVDGYVLGHDHDWRFFELSSTSTRAVPLPDFPAHGRNLALIHRRRIFLSDSIKIRLFDGTMWTDDFDLPLGEDIIGFGGDNNVVAYGGQFGIVRERDGPSQWAALPHPLGAIRVRDVQGMGGGRFVVVGDKGLVAAWTGSGWCVLEAGTAADLGSIGVSSSRRVAYVAANRALGERDVTILLRVDVPPPTP
jgi:hypothetical protein